MDIKISTEQKPINLQKIWIMGAVLVVVMLSFWVMNQPSGPQFGPWPLAPNAHVHHRWTVAPRKDGRA